MIEKTTIRTTGVIFLIVANVLLLFSFLFSMYSGGKPNSDRAIGVLCISQENARFPESEYQAVFSGLGLISSFVHIDATDEEELEASIRVFIKKEELSQVILMTYGDTAGIGLKVADSEESVIGIITIMPVLSNPTLAASLGTNHPGKPVAIFDCSASNASLMFERLSGEDSVISKPFVDSGIFPSTVRISPDSNRYLCLKKLTGETMIDAFVFPSLPDIQYKVGNYVENYLLEDFSGKSDVRGLIFMNQAFKIVPAAMLIAGLFLFLATLSKESSLKGITAKEVKKEAEIPQELSLLHKIERSEKYLFGLWLPVSLAAAAMMCLFVLMVPQYAALAAGLWPVASMLFASVFYLKHLDKLSGISKVTRIRFLISLSVSGLFVLGVFLLIVMHVGSIAHYISFPHSTLPLITTVLLCVSLIVCQKIESFYTQSERNANHNRGFLSALRFRGIVILPFIAMLIAALLSGKVWLFVLVMYYIAVLLFSDWFRRRVKRMSGTLILSAVITSLLYVILAFI
jgi:hypothetical protein